MFAKARAAVPAELGVGLDGQVAARAGGPGWGGFRIVVDLGDGSVLRLAQCVNAATGQRGQ
jgi:hypothetical protein